MNLTQKQIIIEYIKEFKTFVPARMGGKFYRGQIFGSEIGRRCRELYEAGFLEKKRDGKFEVYFLKRSGCQNSGTRESFSKKSDIELNEQLLKILGQIKPSWDNLEIIKEIKNALSAKYPNDKIRVLQLYGKEI